MAVPLSCVRVVPHVAGAVVGFGFERFGVVYDRAIGVPGVGAVEEVPVQDELDVVFGRESHDDRSRHIRSLGRLGFGSVVSGFDCICRQGGSC